MAQKAYCPSHAKWMCKHHIVFMPKYRRKIIYNQIRRDIGEILRGLCEYKGVETIEGHLMPDHVHILVGIPPKISVSSSMGYLKGESAPMVFDKRANLKCRFGNRRFWAGGCYVSTVGLNEAAIAKYIREQEAADIALDRLSVKEYEDPFVKRWLRPLDGPATSQVAVRPERSEGRAPLDARPAPQGLYPKSKPPL